MANQLSLGLVIGGSVGASLGQAFRAVGGNIDQLKNKGRELDLFKTQTKAALELGVTQRKASLQAYGEQVKLGDALKARHLAATQQLGDLNRSLNQAQASGDQARLQRLVQQQGELDKLRYLSWQLNQEAAAQSAAGNKQDAANLRTLAKATQEQIRQKQAQASAEEKADAAKVKRIQQQISEQRREAQQAKHGLIEHQGELGRIRSSLRANTEEAQRLGDAYRQASREAQAVELKTLGQTQVSQGRQGLKSSVGQAIALSAALAVPTKVSGDYQAQIRQMALWAHTAGSEDEQRLAQMISEVARNRGMGERDLATAVAGLIEKGIDWEESASYAGLIADLIDGQGMEASTIATLFSAFKEAGVQQQDMGAMLGQVAAAGDIGAFGPKEMAKYLPSLLGTISKLGMQGPEAVRFLGASLQSQFSQTQDAAAAATNMSNLLEAVISSTSQERFAKQGIDLAGSITTALSNGTADNPVDAFIKLTEKLLARQDPARAKRIAQLRSQVQAAQQGSAEEAAAFAAILESAGLASIVSDKSASAGLLAQIKYGGTIRDNQQAIKDTDGRIKIEQDAARAREASNARWATATKAMESSMRSLGDAVRPITDRVADGIAWMGYALAGLADRFPGVVSGVTALTAGVIAVGAAFNAIKISRGLLNLGRGSLMGNPNVVQRVFVTNPGAAGMGAAAAGRGLGGAVGALGKGAGYAKGLVPLAVAGAGLQALDTFLNAETRDQKAEGYGAAAGGLGGTLAGAMAGAALGSVVPVIGTAVGGLIGGMLGAWGGGELGGSASKRLFGDKGLFSGKGEASMGDAARALSAQNGEPVPVTLANPAPTPMPVEQTFTFSPSIPVTVQGDMREPSRLAEELMPHLHRQFKDFADQVARRELFDAPHL